MKKIIGHCMAVCLAFTCLFSAFPMKAVNALDESSIAYTAEHQTRNPNRSDGSSAVRKITVTLEVSDDYRPQITYYCNTEAQGNYWCITSICHVSLESSTNHDSKAFSGVLTSWLRSPYQIEYSINGDFYKHESQTKKPFISGSFKPGESIVIQSHVSKARPFHHYSYFYDHKTVSLQS